MSSQSDEDIFIDSPTNKHYCLFPSSPKSVTKMKRNEEQSCTNLY